MVHRVSGAYAPPMLPEHVRLEVGKQEVLRAPIDRGLAIAKRTAPPGAGEPVEGNFVGTLGSRVAVILRAPDAIGLALTSDLGRTLPSFIRQCRKAFRDHSSPPRTMTLGYNPQGPSDDLEQDRRAFEELFDNHASQYPGVERLELARKETASHTDAERRRRLADGLCLNHARWVAHLANRFKAQAVELPYAAVLVPRRQDQARDVFTGKPGADGLAADPDLKRRGPQRARHPELALEDHTSRPGPAGAHSWSAVSLAALEGILFPHAAAPGPAKAVEPTDRRLAPQATAVTAPSVQSPGIPVRVFIGATRLCSRALMAEMDEGLVTAHCRDAIDGLYSEGFASCTAVVLTSDTLIGLAHVALVGDDLRNGVRDLRAEFEQLLTAREGPKHAPVQLILGYSPEALRRQLMYEAEGGSVDAFIRSNECFTEVGHESLIEADAALQDFWKDATPARIPTDAERLDWAIDSMLRSRLRELMHISSSQRIVLPHAALLVRRDGSIETFTQAPRYERL